MRIFHRQPKALLAWAIACVSVVLLVVAGCQISPRLIVTSTGPSPTPSPTETPTPGITPTPTPVPSPITSTPTPTPAGFATPTPTPTSMAGAVDRKNQPSQFLFTSSPDSRLLLGFRINSDGSLAPVSGSPFVTRAPLRSLASTQNALVAAGEDSIFVFSVDRETGLILQTDMVKTAAITRLTADLSANTVIATTSAGKFAFRIERGKLTALPDGIAASEIVSAKTQSPPSAVLDASGRFMYVVDAGKAELAAFQVGQGRPVALSPPVYPVAQGTSAIALVKR